MTTDNSPDLSIGLFPDMPPLPAAKKNPPPKKKRAAPKKKKLLDAIADEVNNLTIPESRWGDLDGSKKSDFVLGAEEARVELARFLLEKVESGMLGPSFRESVGPWRTLGDLVREAAGDAE